MKRTTPDRWERQMENAFQRWVNGPQEEGWLTEFTKELRREHRALVRIVKSHTGGLTEQDKLDELYRGYIAACEYILQDLHARAQ